MTRPIAFGIATALATSAAVAASDLVREAQDANELRANWFIGTSVDTAGPGSTSIGSVEDLIIDENGRVTAVVISVGGFLGIGSKSVAVAWDQLQIEYDGSELQIDTTRTSLEGAPEFAYRDQERRPPPAPATGTGTGMTPPNPAAPPPQ
jgi:hypothetical protein